MDEFPLEIIVHILKYLSKEDQIIISEVNRKFREAFFSPPLWTEHEKSMEVPPGQMKSFRKFLKQTPWLKYLNLQVGGYENMLPSSVNLTSVFKPLNNLECVSLQLNRCTPSKTFFPYMLKHISLVDCGLIEREKFITDNILIRIADSCPQLEHIQIKSASSPLYTCKGMTYLLKKVKGTLQTLILSVPYYGDDPYINFLDCPPNLTSLCLKLELENIFYNEWWLKLPNLENLQILSLGDLYYSDVRAFSTILVNCSLTNLRFLYIAHCFPFVDEDFYAKFIKLPNLHVLYLDYCSVDVDVLVRFVKDCVSLKVLVWKDSGGYSKTEIFRLEKLKKETPVKIYLSSTSHETKNVVFNFPSFPNENFDCLKTFNHMFDEIFDTTSPNYFKCNAPIIKKSKVFLGKL